MIRTAKMWALVLAMGCGGGASYSSNGATVETTSRTRVTASADSTSFAAEEAAPMAAPAMAGGDFGGGEAAAADMAAPPSPAPVSRAAVATGGASAAPTAAPVSSSSRAAAPTTVRTTTTVTVTVDTPTPPPVVEPEPQQYMPAARMLTAASVGDHDRRGNYLEFLSRHPYEARRMNLDMSRRVRFRVVDAQNQPVNDAQVVISVGNQTIQGRTHADGRWDFFPGVSAPWARGSAVVQVVGAGARGAAQISIPTRGDGQDVTLRLNGVQQQTPRTLDLAFLIDVTGSMEDELRYVNREVSEIVARVESEAPEVNVRVGAVFYRDRTDSVPLQRIGFTENVQGFARAMQTVRASGGGDYPEDVNAGLQTAIQGLEWSQGNAARVLVVIADAPPKRYSTQYTYREAMIEAGMRGIRLLPVAASGANREVEYLFRAMGTFTSSPYVYLTDDSGIGNPHQEADTDRVAVEYFNDLLTRLMISDVRGRGMHEPGSFGASS